MYCLSNICQNLMTRLMPTTVNTLSTVFLGPWRPEVCGQLPLALLSPSSLDIKEASTRYFLKMALRTRFPIFSVGTFSINKLALL